MTSGEINDVFYELFLLAVRLGGPILLVAMGVGVVVSIIQAATQINEQTLTFVPKVFVIGIMLVVTGNMMLTELQDFVKHILELIVRG